MEVKDIQIEQYSDGWAIEVDGRRYRWDHNDGDLGVDSIKLLLEYLGHTVTVEDIY